MLRVKDATPPLESAGMVGNQDGLFSPAVFGVDLETLLVDADEHRLPAILPRHRIAIGLIMEHALALTDLT